MLEARKVASVPPSPNSRLSATGGGTPREPCRRGLERVVAPLPRPRYAAATRRRCSYTPSSRSPTRCWQIRAAPCPRRGLIARPPPPQEFFVPTAVRFPARPPKAGTPRPLCPGVTRWKHRTPCVFGLKALAGVRRCAPVSQAWEQGAPLPRPRTDPTRPRAPAPSRRPDPPFNAYASAAPPGVPIANGHSTPQPGHGMR